MSALENARFWAKDLLSLRASRWPRPWKNSGFADAMDYAKDKFRAAMRELRKEQGDKVKRSCASCSRETVNTRHHKESGENFCERCCEAAERASSCRGETFAEYAQARAVSR